jgi:hypothetical protein
VILTVLKSSQKLTRSHDVGSHLNGKRCLSTSHPRPVRISLLVRAAEMPRAFGLHEQRGIGLLSCTWRHHVVMAANRRVESRPMQMQRLSREQLTRVHSAAQRGTHPPAIEHTSPSASASSWQPSSASESMRDCEGRRERGQSL